MARFERTTQGCCRLLGAGYGTPGALTELDGYVRVPVCSHGPRGGDPVVRAHDVGAVLGAVHEHGVELGVVDAAAPIADVLTCAVAEMTSKVEARPVGVGRRHPALTGKTHGVGDCHRAQARAPVERTQARCGTVPVDERLRRRSDDERWRHSPHGGCGRGWRRGSARRDRRWDWAGPQTFACT